MIENKYSVHVFAAPGRRHIRRDTVVPHARNLDFAIARPSLGLIRSLATGTKASEEEGFPEIAIVAHFISFFRTMSDRAYCCKTNEGL